MPLLQIIRENGSVVDKSLEPALPDATLVAMYGAMSLARRLDERGMILQRQGRLGFYGASTGEEAAVVGSGTALEATDWVFPALRQSALLLMRGYPLSRYFAHMFGTAASVEKGRSMPMHFSDRAYHFVTWSSSMATQLPHAVGMAYAAKLKRAREIAIGYMGDGATSEQDFHVAMNFAAVWKVPVVFFCNNNQWAISVPFSKQTASGTVAVKAAGYGMPGVRVDGNDVLACYVATRDAVERARRGEGPTLIEAVTYRMMGHSSSDDPTRYRDASEVAEWARRDPLARFKAYLMTRGLWDDAKETALADAQNKRILDAIAEAEKSPQPAHDSLVEDVYAEVPWHLAAELRELQEARGW
ncbi:MAG: pyruvate dehydrogenase (acetyl-transferring) E1 component subunit alpha [Thermoplasmatota archaeon]